MPALTNPKHERFAQERAKGTGQFEAYRLVGYAGDEAHASRLEARADVRGRIAELQERAAIRTELTAASITERLLSIADKAEQTNAAPGLGVARQALMDAAKLNGLVVEKAEHNVAAVTRIIIEAADGHREDPAST